MTEEREELEVSVKAVGAGIAQTANFTARLKDDTTSMEAELERVLNEQEDLKTHISNLAVEFSSTNAEINDMKIKMKPLVSWCDAIERDQ
ncbi:hypothetical protein SCHPADRAFT_573235 [Schizopora paradoxa]|uniref:Uncharacterized protein n=1 Tax=Schizopora paradoxa TaxID=27342 RepID=A0A0H2RWW3_9AGAM|nr:hypothetical protein SCHPADRAFT_573235 [Schizopora paradoxa]